MTLISGTISLATETACAASSGVHIDAVNCTKRRLYSASILSSNTDEATYHEIWLVFLHHGSDPIYACVIIV